jgi:transglutaminase-like putative cysteine protease
MAVLIQTVQAKRFLLAVLALALVAAGGGGHSRNLTSSPESAKTRRFSFTYSATIDRIPDGQSAHVYVPIAVETPHQRIEHFDVEASFAGRVEHEPVYGNRFWHGTLESGQEPTTVTVRYTVERKLLRKQAPDHAVGALGEAELQEMELFLRPSDRVVVGHEILAPILKEIHQEAGVEDKGKIARSIYDWVVENIEYKKIGTGWGNGDTFWACNERYGNCTDFHSLFISLARTEGIPAKFQMGFPIPMDRAEGKICGYHCWLEFYSAGVGWFPIDASEAFKHPDKHEMFFGTHPADRFHVTTGRDLRLGPDHRGPSLNYFIYPYVEVDGKPFSGKVETTVSYEELPLKRHASLRPQ